MGGGKGGKGGGEQGRGKQFIYIYIYITFSFQFFEAIFLLYFSPVLSLVWFPFFGRAGWWFLIVGHAALIRVVAEGGVAWG